MWSHPLNPIRAIVADSFLLGPLENQFVSLAVRMRDVVYSIYPMMRQCNHSLEWFGSTYRPWIHDMNAIMQHIPNTTIQTYFESAYKPLEQQYDQRCAELTDPVFLERFAALYKVFKTSMTHNFTVIQCIGFDDSCRSFVPALISAMSKNKKIVYVYIDYFMCFDVFLSTLLQHFAVSISNNPIDNHADNPLEVEAQFGFQQLFDVSAYTSNKAIFGSWLKIQL